MKRPRVTVGLALGAILAAAGGMVVVLRSDWLRDTVRAKLTGELARATGARVELAGYRFHWATLHVELEGLTLHGSEAPAQQPFFRARLIRLGLGVKSVFDRHIDLRSLRVEQPEVNIYVAADGSTNLPHPATARSGNTVEDLLKLHIGSAVIADGRASIADRRLDFSGNIEGLSADLRYSALPARYEGEVKIGRISGSAAGDRLPPIAVDAVLALAASRLHFDKLRLSAGRSWAEISGAVENFAKPSASGRYTAAVSMNDLPKGSLTAGEFHGDGQWNWSPAAWHVATNVRGKGLLFLIRGHPTLVDAADGYCEVGAAGIHCPRLNGSLLGGTLKGRGEWDKWRQLEIAGDLDRVAVERVRPIVDVLPAAWHGLATGPARFTAGWTGASLHETILGGKLDATPAPGSWPLRGMVDFEWRQAEETVYFGPSVIETPATRVAFDGVVDRRLTLNVTSSDAHDLETGLRLGLQDDTITLPFRLEGGKLEAIGTLEGPTASPLAKGKFSATNLVYQDVRYDRVDSGVAASASRVELIGAQVTRETATVSGSASASLTAGKLTGDSVISGSLAVRQADLAVFARILGADPSVTGHFNATLAFRGTYDRPEATLQFDSPEIRWSGEKLEKLEATVRFRNDGRERVEATVAADGAKVALQGVYEHPSGEWSNGRLEFNLRESKLAIGKVENVTAIWPGISGTLEANFDGALRMVQGHPHWERLAGQAVADKLALDGAALGRLEAIVRPGPERAEIELAANIEGSLVRGHATLGFTGDYPLAVKVDVPRLPLRLIRTLTADSSASAPRPPLPVRGLLEGEVQLDMALARPSDFRASAAISNVQIRPRSDEILDTQINTSELILRNAGPIRIEADHNGVRVAAAKFTALETNLTLTGGYLFNSRAPWDLRVTGAVNLAVAGNFRPEAQASGTATLDAALRGAAGDPQLSGRMSIADASLFLHDVPNGIEHASGTVYFERNRANIERISGQTGSGNFELSGFVAFGAETSYRLLAKATNIRVRYPEGVSTVLDADLALGGSSTRSLLSGTLTIARSGFTSRSDLAGMVASSGSPLPMVATDNELLRNMQFDVRIRTTPNATLISQYTQDVQPDADLRLRGSILKPVLLGRVAVNQGLLQFFGNRYTVSRGELLFYSTATLAPSLDLDLETRIRGVTVYLNISGPISRLKVNYRSEPPLQANEILALLTVGRPPAAQSTALPTAPGTGNPALTESSTNSLLGGALSGAVSARVERFFGASRIKIDPQLTGVDNIPQARITVEQSISRDVTLTFVSNLNRAQQQVVRLEWDLNREWSLIAVRDENGVFGVDFLLKKRFR